MTIPIGRYASLGPEIPIEGMPDCAPLRIVRLAELAERNALNETVILVDAVGEDDAPIKLILGANPHTAEITRAAVWLRPGAGFVACDTACLPGNLVDIVRTILLDPRSTP
jgi:hypothetical protein